jgi:hypothetical protein
VDYVSLVKDFRQACLLAIRAELKSAHCAWLKELHSATFAKERKLLVEQKSFKRENRK